ncbi:hypothetical protein [Corynebacterium sp. H130]|uniref:hypothetical protein n=1 Tax=Corynebacterium sp. H130 TaxID=3133444 RepID=UPI0030B0357F
MSLQRRLAIAIFSAALLSGPQVSVATEVGTHEMTYLQLNESQMGIVSDDYTFEIENGNAVAIQKGTNQKEQLPQTAVDNSGTEIQLKYAVSDNGELLVSAVTPSNGDRNIAKCALGTVGGAGGGAVAGGLGGAAVGTVTLPVVGTVGAGVVGAVGGGVFGGMTGAAASCFD